MTRYRRRSRIGAPLATVWTFHTTVEGLVAVTPAWLRLRVESVRGPGGSPGQDVLEAGSTVRLSVRPFGVGPRRGWTTRVVELRRGASEAAFRDEMVEGPFPRWEHTHRFRAAGDETVMMDVVEYALPLLPGPLSSLGWPAFEAMFAHRHRETRRLLEPGGPAPSDGPAVS